MTGVQTCALPISEMRFFRALEYFNKIQLLGDVPWLEAVSYTHLASKGALRPIGNRSQSVMA